MFTNNYKGKKEAAPMLGGGVHASTEFYKEVMNSIVMKGRINMNKDLRGANLSNKYLYNEDLAEADLTNATLAHSFLNKANLYGANLSNAILSTADLTNANLLNANLFNADLSNANLSEVCLHEANLSNADLTDACLIHADLEHANLSNANLIYAHLQYAWLYNADLCNADLSNANLFKADLSNADLTGAILTNANFDGACLMNVKLPKGEEIRKGVILKEDLIGYKKGYENEIIKLLIPKGNIVFSINNCKCRTNSAKVLEITNEDGGNVKTANSRYDNSFAYVVGATVEVDDFDLRYNVECAAGIHFFRTREEAEWY